MSDMEFGPFPGTEAWLKARNGRAVIAWLWEHLPAEGRAELAMIVDPNLEDSSRLLLACSIATDSGIKIPAKLFEACRGLVEAPATLGLEDHYFENQALPDSMIPAV